MELGSQQYDLGSASGQSLDGSFRKTESVISSRSASSISASTKYIPTSRRAFKAIKECSKNLVDIDIFTQSLEDWIVENSNDVDHSFRLPFLIDELQNLDFALESVLFQQLHRMPCSPHASYNSKEDVFLALEDFLHTISDSLWHTFWDKSGPPPYSVLCPRHSGSKFYAVEKAISRGRLDSLCGAALVSKTEGDQQAHWDQVVQFALFRPDITMGNESMLSSSSICEALFYGIHILLSRTLSKYTTASSDCLYILVLDSNFGGVVKLAGDLQKLELVSGNPYLSMVKWIKHHAEINVSQVDRIWNKLGNANWRDLGTLQVLLATFYSIVQWSGAAKKSIASLASDHSLRLHQRRLERSLVFKGEKSIVAHQDGEIVKVDNRNADDPCLGNQDPRLKLKQGEVVVLEDQQDQEQRSFQVQESLHGLNSCCYRAVALDYPTEPLTLYVGAHPSRLEPSWEDMSLWYQVQRQTKVLNIFREQGISSKHLPQIIACGRMLHSGHCKRQSPKGRCDHPLCGTPILVVHPVGGPLSTKAVPFTSEDAIRCCRDCLAALRSAKTANVQHGDICPENIVFTTGLNCGVCVYALVSWGRAVLEDKDMCPAVNLQFSSAHALQHGKLCPSSDAESLVYLLYYICGGKMPTQQQVDSIESALKWRQRCWAKRVIQQHLGEVSSILKAFADYVDSLCGTPYPFDYDVWLERFNRAVDGSGNRGKVIEQVLRIEDVPESSGIGENSLSC